MHISSCGQLEVIGVHLLVGALSEWEVAPADATLAVPGVRAADVFGVRSRGGAQGTGAPTRQDVERKAEQLRTVLGGPDLAPQG